MGYNPIQVQQQQQSPLANATQAMQLKNAMTSNKINEAKLSQVGQPQPLNAEQIKLVRDVSGKMLQDFETYKTHPDAQNIWTKKAQGAKQMLTQMGIPQAEAMNFTPEAVSQFAADTEGMTEYQKESLALRREMADQNKGMNQYQASMLNLKQQELTGQGKPPPGQRYNSDGNLEYIPGSQQENKFKKDMTKDYLATKSSQSELASVKKKAYSLATHPGLGSATGYLGALPSLPGGEAKKAENLLEEFKSSVKMAGLKLVRQGGSIGMMTEKEWPIVESMVANIDPLAGKQAVKDQIDKVTAKIESLTSDTVAAFNAQYGDSLPKYPQFRIAGGAPTPNAQAAQPTQAGVIQVDW